MATGTICGKDKTGGERKEGTDFFRKVNRVRRCLS